MPDERDAKTTDAEKKAYSLGLYHGFRAAAQVAERVHPSAASAVGEAHMRSYRDAIVYAIREQAYVEWRAKHAE